jgi:hypothetical protein
MPAGRLRVGSPTKLKARVWPSTASRTLIVPPSTSTSVWPRSGGGTAEVGSTSASWSRSSASSSLRTVSRWCMASM